MGCDYYNVYGYDKVKDRWSKETISIHFSESNDDYPCLCTLASQTSLGSSDVRSLAILGAAVVLLHHGELPLDDTYLPGSIPQWMREDIERLVR